MSYIVPQRINCASTAAGFGISCPNCNTKFFIEAKDSRYAFSYFDESTIIREAGASKVSFTFEGKTGEVKKIERKLGGALDFFFFNFYKTEYDITIPSKEYIRYE